MNKLNKVCLYIVLISVAITNSCKKDNPSEPEKFSLEVSTHEILLNKDGLNENGAKAKFSVIASAGWSSENDSWITLSLVNGAAGTTSVEVTASAVTEARNGKITITCGDQKEEITVRQSAEVIIPASLQVTPTAITVEANGLLENGDEPTISIKTNKNWTIEYDEAYDWITADALWGDAGEDIIVTFTIDEYLDTENDRVAILKVIAETSEEEITVTQLKAEAKDPYAFELLWEDTYDASDAWVWSSSPAVSKDGEYVYVFSTGFFLVAYTKDGEKMWSKDLNLGGVLATGGRNGSLTSKRNPGTTPSVDPADGTVYIGVGYNNTTTTRPNGYLYAMKGGAESAGGGTIKWTCAPLEQTIQRFYAPVVTEDYVIIAHGGRANASAPGIITAADSHLEVYSKNDGIQRFAGHVNTGSSGGLLALKSGRIVASTANASAGARLFIPNETTGLWNQTSGSSNNNNNLGYGGLFVRSSQPAAGPNGKIYLLGKTGSATFVTGAPTGQTVVVFFENVNAHVQGTATAYTWAVPVKGAFPDVSEGDLQGMGLAVGENGVVYAATCKERESTTLNSAWITAITPTGTIKWEHQAEGNIQGVPAIDNLGNVYYFDWEVGKLVMLNSETGDELSQLQIGDTFTLAAGSLIGGGSSPTIAPDGTIYVNAMKEGKPAIFAIRGIATGMSDSWSQLGGNHSKTGYMY